MKIEENIPLLPLTYYKIGGSARFFAKPESVSDLYVISDFLSQNPSTPLFILGAGSNILVPDRGFEGLVIQTASLNKELTVSGSEIICGASTMVIHLLRLAMREGYDGLDMLTGIPGSMGGVFAMNAGTKGGEIKDILTSITVFDLHTKQPHTYFGDQLNFSYRKNHFVKPSEIILSGIVKFTQSKPELIQERITKMLEARKATQPIDKPSCGSVFKNPDPQNGIFAWKLIDEAGLRGHRIGNAQISEMHSNFIVNLGGASSDDVLGLIALAKAKVFEKSGISLEEEVRIL